MRLPPSPWWLTPRISCGAKRRRLHTQVRTLACLDMVSQARPRRRDRIANWPELSTGYRQDQELTQVYLYNEGNGHIAPKGVRLTWIIHERSLCQSDGLKWTVAARGGVDE